MPNLTREQILARKLGQHTVEIDGGTVTVRGLNRDEALGVQEYEETADRDNYIISVGMIDPKMSMEDVAVWASQDSAGELSKVSEKIARLSGMMADSGKEAYKSTRRRSRS